jgi:hypothetical protein
MCTYATYEEDVTGMTAPMPYIVSHGNMTCNLCLFDVCSFSQGQNYGTEQALPVMLNVK